MSVHPTTIYTIDCDVCHDSEIGPFATERKAGEAIKANGWTAKPTVFGYRLTCPGCQPPEGEAAS